MRDVRVSSLRLQLKTTTLIRNFSMILTVAVDAPLRRVFDYTFDGIVADHQQIIGARVHVGFGHSSRVGVVLGVRSESEIASDSLKPVLERLDFEPLFDSDLMQLLTWSARYYKHSIGEVFANAMPVLLRDGLPLTVEMIDRWQCVDLPDTRVVEKLSKAPKQQALYQRLASAGAALSAQQISEHATNWRPALKALCEKGLVVKRQSLPLTDPLPATQGPELNPEQCQCVESISVQLEQYQAFLLNGITGSGKTEVYLTVIEKVVAKQQQALVMIPEIGLTGQLLDRFRRRFDVPVIAMHSGLSNRQRLDAWVLARSGEASIIIGTRSSVFVPTDNLGIIIVDEEHDLSFKQQDGFRYHARDIAVKRAQLENIPVILGSATPSLESLHNVQRGHYKMLELTQRTGSAQLPNVRLIDARHQKMRGAVSEVLLDSMQQHLDRGQQVLLFINRRGYAPVLLCHACGHLTKCRRCDCYMTYHRQREKLICHQCHNEYRLPTHCSECNQREFVPVGVGTQRIEEVLTEHFPDKVITRIDRDNTRRKGELQQKLDDVENGTSDIVIGTQMVTKGHDFPNITLVGILDTDQSLFSHDFRAHERAAQLISQVSGRSGRAEKAGEVLIQTHQPEHPLFQTLIHAGYGEFAEAALGERATAVLPPVGSFALMRAESQQARLATDFLNDVVALVGGDQRRVQCLGPVSAPMERRAGRFRYQLLFQSESRSDLQVFLDHWIVEIEKLKSARKVRWSLDVDPMELF